MKEIKGIQIQTQMGEEKTPEELIQMARNKTSPKIHVWILKSPIIECDHIKSDVVEFPYSRNFEKFKQCLGINQIPLFGLKFKSFEF